VARPRWTVIATYIPTTPPTVHAIATGSRPKMPSVMTDSWEPVPTTSGFEITRRGGSGDVAATGAAGEERYVERAFGVAGAAPRAPHCARIVSYHLKAEAAPPSAQGDSPRPRC
jgi:hypothetical protein